MYAVIPHPDLANDTCIVLHQESGQYYIARLVNGNWNISYIGPQNGFRDGPFDSREQAERRALHICPECNKRIKIGQHMFTEALTNGHFEEYHLECLSRIHYKVGGQVEGKARKTKEKEED